MKDQRAIWRPPGKQRVAVAHAQTLKGRISPVIEITPRRRCCVDALVKGTPPRQVTPLGEAQRVLRSPLPGTNSESAMPPPPQRSTSPNVPNTPPAARPLTIPPRPRPFDPLPPADLSSSTASILPAFPEDIRGSFKDSRADLTNPIAEHLSLEQSDNTGIPEFTTDVHAAKWVARLQKPKPRRGRPHNALLIDLSHSSSSFSSLQLSQKLQPSHLFASPTSDALSSNQQGQSLFIHDNHNDDDEDKTVVLSPSFSFSTSTNSNECSLLCRHLAAPALKYYYDDDDNNPIWIKQND